MPIQWCLPCPTPRRRDTHDAWASGSLSEWDTTQAAASAITAGAHRATGCACMACTRPRAHAEVHGAPPTVSPAHQPRAAAHTAVQALAHYMAWLDPAGHNIHCMTDTQHMHQGRTGCVGSSRCLKHGLHERQPQQLGCKMGSQLGCCISGGPQKTPGLEGVRLRRHGRVQQQPPHNIQSCLDDWRLVVHLLKMIGGEQLLLFSATNRM